MKFAFADPPYFGCGKSHYGEHHPDAADFDRIETHAALVGQLCAEFDGWALSCHQKSLKAILNICPVDIRIGAWVKLYSPFMPNVSPSYAWEPVIFRGGRKRKKSDPFMRDWVSANTRGQHARNKSMQDGKALAGGKPDAFCWWVFDFLGMQPEDEFHDLFPGSGAVGRAWDIYRRADYKTPLFHGVLD